MKKDEEHKKPVKVPGDEYYIKYIQSGNHRAFGMLYEKYFKILYTYALYIVNNELIAEDVTEEVFVKIWENHKTLVIKSSLKAYLFQMTRNACLDQIKSLNIRKSYKKEIQDRCRIEGYLSDPAGPEEQLMNEELAQMLKSEINKFPPKVRRIFKMSRFFHIKNKDIAIKENVSESTVEKSIRKVLDHLTKKLFNLPVLVGYFLLIFTKIITVFVS